MIFQNVSIRFIMKIMRYTFRSETETVYLNADYKLVILSSNGTSLKNGETTLTAMVRRISDGSDVQFDPSCFTWKRHELSESFQPLVSNVLKVTSDMLVEGSATFICEFSKSGLYWKDTAMISVSATNQGANAPYQRTVYKVADEKPERPDGNASELPEGWSLTPPPRTNNWPVWASTGYVTFGADNTPIYSEWSDPVEWTGETAYPIVQWQWGTSPTVPPDKTHSILIIDGDVMIFTDEQGSFAFVESGEGQWSDHIPTDHDGKPYLWKREYNWQHTSTEDEWFYYPAQGPEGLTGAYQSIGYIIVGTNSVIFAGLDEDKNPTLPTMHVFIEDISYYFKTITVTLDDTADIYYLIAVLGDNGIAELQVGYITYRSDGSTARTVWKDYLTGEEIPDGFVLAEIRMNGADIKSVAVVTPRRFDAQEKISFMEILNSENMDDINIAAEALGVERVFTKVAALEAFINELKANRALITAFRTENFLLQTGRMRMRIGEFNNTPVFQADYMNEDGEYETVFMVEFSSGNIFFGMPNSDFTAPAHGFMYRASDQYLIGPNGRFELSASGNMTATNVDLTGKITANSGTFTGTIYANNGRFSGEVNCDGLRVIPQDNYSIPQIYIGNRGASQAAYFCRMIYDSIYSDGPTTGYSNISRINGRCFKCSTSGISNTRNISFITTLVLKVLNSVQCYVIFLDSLYRTIPSTALIGDILSQDYSGNIGDILTLITIANINNFADLQDDDSDGVYYNNPYTYINIYSDYDNVYLNVQENPTEADKDQMLPGQLYIDSNGFVKAITLSEFLDANMSTNSLRQQNIEGNDVI